MITGHLGYIGPVLTRMAKAFGHDVTGLDCGYFQDCGDIPSDFLPHRQIWRDIREVTLKDLEGIEAILHLAALSNDPIGALDPRWTEAINLGATLSLAKMAKHLKIRRFIFASSCSLYGATGGEEALSETATVAPVSAYARSKIEAEKGLATLADKDFCPVFLRNATAFGMGPRPRFDLVVNNLCGFAYSDGIIKLLSDGTPWRPLVHIEDIALAMLCALEAGEDKVRAQAFNIGRNDSNYRVKDIAVKVAEYFPDTRFEILGEGGKDNRSYRVCFDKALETLPGFSPLWTLDMGLQEAVAWLQAGGLQEADFQNWRFNRLPALQKALKGGHMDPSLRLMSLAA